MATTTNEGITIHDSTENHEGPAVKRPRVEELPSNNNARAQQSESEPGNLSGNDPAEVSEVLLRLIA